MGRILFAVLCAVVVLVGVTAESRAGGTVHSGPPIQVFNDVPECPENACCTRQEGCCYSNAGSCTGGSTCKCSKSCGQGIAICSCSCTAGGSGTSIDPGPTPSLDGGDVHLRADGSELATLQRFAEAIEEQTGWKVIFPVVAKDLRLAGEWSGTFEHIITVVPLSVGLSAVMDGKATTITLQH